MTPSLSNLHTVTGDISWMRRAACKGRTDIAFFGEPESLGPGTPPRLSHESKTLMAEALLVCASCPVRTPCRNYAHRNRILHGIWGGETQTQRRKILKGNRGLRSA